MNLTKKNYSEDDLIEIDKETAPSLDFPNLVVEKVCVPKDGGTMYGGIAPYANNSYNIGSSDKKYANIYSTNFVGNASTATKLSTARTIALTGSVTGSGTFDGSGNLSIATTTNHTHNYAGSYSAGGDATRAIAVADYGDTSKTIKIGFSGAGASTGNLAYIAGYLTGGTQIKDVSKDTLKSWLGLDNADNR